MSRTKTRGLRVFVGTECFTTRHEHLCLLLFLLGARCWHAQDDIDTNKRRIPITNLLTNIPLLYRYNSQVEPQRVKVFLCCTPNAM